MSMFCGLPDAEKSSSRVLKPPGGGHSDIFGSPEKKTNHGRPKYDQQNSSNISGALGTADANETCEKTARAMEHQEQKDHPNPNAAGHNTNQHVDDKAEEPHQTNKRHRVPPGGHSTGFW